LGATYVDGKLTGPAGTTASVRFLVDSGARYSLVPDGVWQELGIAPTRTVDVVLADGTVVSREVGECVMEFKEGRGTSPVFLGQPGDEPLLGAVTLEILGLVLNPFTRTLHPMRMLLV